MKINRKKLPKLGLIVGVLLASIVCGVVFGLSNKPEGAVAKDEACKVNHEPFCVVISEDAEPVKPNKKYKLRQTASLIGQTVAAQPIGNASYVYSIETRGSVRTSIASFAASVAQTLADPRGWSKRGKFARGNSSNFIIVLTPAANVPSFSSACSSAWSCRVGPYVIINEDRWLGATTAWNNAGGSLRDYQHMVINHEVGHWLGYGHASCSGAGNLAPIMQQQSISLQGCKFNPWPLSSEP